MTYNLFGGALNLAQLQLESYPVHFSSVQSVQMRRDDLSDVNTAYGSLLNVSRNFVRKT